MMRFVSIVVTTICLTVVSVANASTLTNRYSDFWIFGDSLSDNGNAFQLSGLPPAPYFNGRVSNGLVWNESIIAEFTANNGQIPLITPPPLPVTFNGNLAVAGALATNAPNFIGGFPVPGLPAQIGTFSALGGAATLGGNPVAAVWAGANDIFAGVNGGNATLAAQNAAASVIGSITALSATFPNVLVFNLPDLGLTPRFAGGANQATATSASQLFNSQLAAGLNALQAMPGGPNIMRVDIFSLFNDVLANPAGSGFVNATDPCLITIACITGSDAVQNSYLFWDDIHPTAGGHALIGQAARQALLAPIPLPAALPFLLGALGACGAIARRRAKAA